MAEGRCIDCGGSFAELELQIAKDGSGTVCARCDAKREMPDVGKLLRRDDRKLGYFLVVAGLGFLSLGLYVGYTILGHAALQEELGLSGGAPGRVIGFALLATFGGGAAAVLGVVKIAASLRR